MDKRNIVIVILGILDVLILAVCICGYVLLGNQTVERHISEKELETVVLHPNFEEKDVKVEESIVINKASQKKADKKTTSEETKVVSEDNQDYIFKDSNSKYITESELKDKTEWELKVARNEIYARHGRKFNDEKLKEYFEKKSWYKPQYSPEEFDALGDSALNQYEIANRDLIKKEEEKR